MSRNRLTVALSSLLFTYLFFFEYLRPFRRVHITGDLEDFHYPLADYAFQALKHGRFPLWDPSDYCGMSLMANVQAALFYPPTWLMFALRWSSERLSYQALEIQVFAHVWLAFFLCYLWLRGKRLEELACVLGAAVFAFGGCMCTQLHHLGQATGYAWIPLGLWGIDQAVDRRSWRPLWKLAAASALCFLAGYTPLWVVFMVTAFVYALAGNWRWKATAGVAASAIVGLALAAVQLLPALQANRLREPELRYEGTREARLLLAFTMPSYMDFSMNIPPSEDPTQEYWYLGVPGLFALPLLIRRRKPAVPGLKNIAPSVAIGIASVVMLTNPYNLVGSVLSHFAVLVDVVRDRYFLAGVTLAFAPLSALALDDFLTRPVRPAPRWIAWVTVACLALWAVADLVRWFGPGFPVGSRSLFDLAATLLLFCAGIFAVRGQSGALLAWTAAALVLFVSVDYKVFGTSKNFDGSPGLGQQYFSDSFLAMDTDAYRQLRGHPQDRILVDQVGLLPARLRHVGLQTPQGFDPLFPAQFRKLLEPAAHFRTDREFEVYLDNDAMLQLLGVRYVISAEPGPWYPQLVGNPKFRLVGSDRYFFRVFEYLPAHPAYGWQSREASRQVSLVGWTPEQRTFAVHSAQGGLLTLSEQFFPGWSASIDGQNVTVERWSGAFQAVDVPGGEHTVIFRFRQEWLRIGAGISLVALVGLVFWQRLDHRRFD